MIEYNLIEIYDNVYGGKGTVTYQIENYDGNKQKLKEFIDVEKIYTNGSKLIQVSRIKQWFDYNNEKQKQLEEENKRLKAEVDLLNDNRHYLNNKIGKAIEYIENKEINNCWLDQYESCELLKILKGV